MATVSSSTPPPDPPIEDSPTNPEATEQDSSKEASTVVVEEEEEVMYKTKSIQFLGRNTPIILQNENGPCPLLAICNVLLLRNNLNLNPDCYEVSQERLMSLVVDRLIDSNSKVNDKEEGYIKNQQQNIADAIDLLPRLTTGIDVNIKFRRIDDFEFTPECAIFDLLDIPLYHGWIVDPQDVEAANAIGSKSYNALMGELVALETHNVEAPGDQNPGDQNPGEDSVDFAAATTAALGVPSPCLSKTRSFEESPPAAAELRRKRKGDLEEETELLQALQLSQGQGLDSAPNTQGDSTTNLDSAFTFSDANQTSNHVENICNLEQFKSEDDKSSENDTNMIEVVDIPTSTTVKSGDLDHDQSHSKESGNETGHDADNVNDNERAIVDVTSSETLLESTKSECSSDNLLKSDAISANSDLSCRSQHDDVRDALTSPVSTDEPMYEGEECVNTVPPVCPDKEPVYEGESLLGKKAEKNVGDCSSEGKATDGLTAEEGELIKNFMKNSASQLTFCGLFRLQEGLKERELCVFFRNNHFCTMFKYEGELYLLATDQGYLNQPDLVWEKLNEVNGDTAFMTSTFKDFKIDDSNTTGASATWDERNAVTNTADYLASINNVPDTGMEVNSDLQLAIALQQQEFEEQSPRSNPAPQPTSVGASRLVTGPQVPRSSQRQSSATTSSSSSRQEGKSSPKDSKCSIM